MKLNKYLYGLSIAAMALMAVACDTDNEGTLYNVLSDPKAGAGASSFSVPSVSVTGQHEDGVTDTPPSVSTTLVRSSATGEATVTFKQITPTPEAFSVPASLTFPDGEIEATLTIGITPNLVPGVYSDTIVVSPASYGATSQFVVKVKVTAASEPADWQRMSGKATYREDFMTTFWGVENLTYKLDIDEDVNHPGVYRLVNPYGEAYLYNEPGDWDETVDSYMVIHAEDPNRVYIDRLDDTMAWGDYGRFTFWCLAGYYLDKGESADDIAADGLFGSLKEGIIKFPKETLLIAMANYKDGGLYLANLNAKFAIALPGYSLGDYSIDATYFGKIVGSDGNEYAVGSINALGKDVATVKAGILRTFYADEAIAAVDADEVETVELDAVGTFRLPVEASGDYMMAVISYDADGGKCESVAIPFHFVFNSDLRGGDMVGWTSLGMATVTSNLFNATFGAPGVTYEVEAQQKDDTPGLYRLVNPYGAAFPYNSPGDYDDTCNYFVEIDATDPNAVVIPLQNTGADWGYGYFHIYSYGAYFLDNGYTKEDIASTQYAGSLQDGVITFPAGSILLFMDQTLYNGNTAEASTVVLPGATAAAPALAPAANRTAQVSHKVSANATKAAPVTSKPGKVNLTKPSRMKATAATAL